MVYVRDRARLIRQSIQDDLRNTLIACRWMPGTTSQPVNNPVNGNFEVVTTADADTYALLAGAPVSLVDYFPEALGEIAGNTPPNTLALDTGTPSEPVQLEMGSYTTQRSWRFHMALFAASEAIGLAVLQDIDDRYQGLLVSHEVVALYDWLADPIGLVTQMEVDSFTFARDVERVVAAEVNLFFAQLILTDFIEP